MPHRIVSFRVIHTFHPILIPLPGAPGLPWWRVSGEVKAALGFGDGAKEVDKRIPSMPIAQVGLASSRIQLG